MWCNKCGVDVDADVDEQKGFACCTLCGRVLEDEVFSSDPTFLKTPSGASQVEGNFVPESGLAPTLTRGPRGVVQLSFHSGDSHEKTLIRGKHEINELADRLSIRPREEIAAAAHRLYKLAVHRNFTRGRRTQQVAAACLYTICRQEQKPYMLIDFSDCIQANVYLLGAVFLQLLQLLRLETHHVVSRPIDPSLFIHRFADRMKFGKSMHTVANTALRLVASMKRDWMQTGRRPAGICGAALFIASHMHGFRHIKKRDVVNVVHVCEATIKKRLGEFETTPNAELTSSEFEKWGMAYEKNEQGNHAPLLFEAPTGSIPNQHRKLMLEGGNKQTGTASTNNEDRGGAGGDKEKAKVEVDMADVVKLCGGFSGGQNPPAFTRNLEQWMLLQQGKAEDDAPGIKEYKEYLEAAAIASELDKVYGVGVSGKAAAGKTGSSVLAEVKDKKKALSKKKAAAAGQSVNDEDINFSDIDDDEIDQYMHTSDESEIKEKLWKQMNAEYLLSRPQPEASALPSTSQPTAAQKKESTTKATRASSRRGKNKVDAGTDAEKQQGGAETASEATLRMLSSKRLSSKVNYSALQELFDEVPQKNATQGANPRRRSTRSADRSNSKNKGKQTDVEGSEADDSRYFLGNIGCGLGLGMGLGDALNVPTPKKKVRFS